MSIRSLFVKIAYDVNNSPLREADKRIGVFKSNVISLRKAFIALGAVATGVAFVLKKAGELEQTTVAFETLTKNVKIGRELLDDLFKFARTTPFRIKGVIGSARLLLGMGIQVKNILPDMKVLGDVAAGLNVPLARLALNFGQVKTQAKLTGRELRDFAVAGVPLLEALSDRLRVSVATVRDLISKNQVVFKDVRAAFRDMTSSTGRFFKLMIRQSKTLPGIFNNILDALEITTMKVGSGLLPAAKKVANEFLKFLDINEKLIKLKATKFFAELGKGLLFTFKVLIRLTSAFGNLMRLFGGLENFIKLASIALAGFITLGLLSKLGRLLGVIGKITLAVIGLGDAAFIANLKAAAIPILIAAAFVALGIVIEDFVVFMKGGRSVIGDFLDFIKKNWPESFRVISRSFDKIKGFFELFKKDMGLFAKGFKSVDDLGFDKLIKAVSNLVDVSRKKFDDFFSVIFDNFDKLRQQAEKIAPGFFGPAPFNEAIGRKSATVTQRVTDRLSKAIDFLTEGIKGNLNIFDPLNLATGGTLAVTRGLSLVLDREIRDLTGFSPKQKVFGVPGPQPALTGAGVTPNRLSGFNIGNLNISVTANPGDSPTRTGRDVAEAFTNELQKVKDNAFDALSSQRRR